MKINELIQDFVIQTSNEEKAMLNKLKEMKDIENFMEREQEVIRNLINKSLVRRIERDDKTMVVANGSTKTI
jgi:DNA-binding MltR family transcriptional regulator